MPAKKSGAWVGARNYSDKISSSDEIRDLSRVAPAENFWAPEAFRPRQNRRDAGIDIKKVIGQRLVAIQVAATKATRQWGQIFTFDISFSRAVRISRSLRSFHVLARNLPPKGWPEKIEEGAAWGEGAAPAVEQGKKKKDREGKAGA